MCHPAGRARAVVAHQVLERERDAPRLGRGPRSRRSSDRALHADALHLHAVGHRHGEALDLDEIRARGRAARRAGSPPARAARSPRRGRLARRSRGSRARDRAASSRCARTWRVPARARFGDRAGDRRRLQPPSPCRACCAGSNRRTQRSRRPLRARSRCRPRSASCRDERCAPRRWRSGGGRRTAETAPAPRPSSAPRSPARPIRARAAAAAGRAGRSSVRQGPQ